MKKRFFGAEYFLGRKFQIPGLEARAVLARDIAYINDDDRELLKKDFASMEPNEVYVFLSAMTVVRRLPSLVTIVAESREITEKSFSHEHTLGLIRLALTYNDEDDYDLTQARLDIASLIRALSHETRLNVLSGLAKFPDDAKVMIAGDKGIDMALAENLKKASDHRLLTGDINDAARALTKLNMPRSLGTLLEILKENEDVSSIENTLQALYLSNSINQDYLESVKSTVGSAGLIAMAKQHLNNGSGKQSLAAILKNYPENLIIGEQELKDSLDKTVRHQAVCIFFAELISGRLHPDDYPKTCSFIVDNFQKISATDVNAPSKKFVRYAADQGRAIDLVDGLALAYRNGCAIHAEKLEFLDFNFKDASLPDLLLALHRKPYKDEYAFRLRRSSLTQTIAVAGILNFEDLVQGMDDKVAEEFVAHLDIMPNKNEVLQKCMKIRQHAFTSDLGL